MENGSIFVDHSELEQQPWKWQLQHVQHSSAVDECHWHNAGNTSLGKKSRQ